MILFSRPNILDGLQMLYPMMFLCHMYPEKILPLAAKYLFDNSSSIFRLESNPETVKIDSILDLCGHICTCYRLDTRKSDEILMAVLNVIPFADLGYTQSIVLLICLNLNKKDQCVTMPTRRKPFPTLNAPYARNF